MSIHLHQDLERLEKSLLYLAAQVEDAVRKALAAVLERRPDLAEEVIRGDRVIDEREVEIEEECLKLLALHQPVATDMRWLISVVKTNSDLERMADLACNIAERAKSLEIYPLFPAPRQIAEMVHISTRMVRDALDSFVEMDAAKAARVISDDDRMDALNLDVIGQLQDTMRSSPDNVDPALHCFSASRHLERIADLATNIAEDLIYLVEGRIVRHLHDTYQPPKDN